VEPSARENVTRLLRQWSAGDAAALDQLAPILYDELRRLAAAYMRRERPGHTLQPTALVNEAYLRLVGEAREGWNDRAHFFAIAARHMRHVLVEHARRRQAQKRGAGGRAVTLVEGLASDEKPTELIALDDALSALAALDERKARIVEIHYFGGLTQEEIATALGVHANTVARELRLARAWLQKEMLGAS
jgi:RNA polymerase sigma factor (TIGR02999 family)